MARRIKAAGDKLDIKLGALDVSPAALAGSDTPTLTMDEMKEIEVQAREEVNAELKTKLREDFLAKTKSAMKKKALFTDGTNERGASLERIRVDLPQFSDRITLDGVIYFHGSSYDFAPAKAAVIKEVMNRQWLHHAEIKGLDVNEYHGRRQSNPTINPRSI